MTAAEKLVSTIKNITDLKAIINDRIYYHHPKIAEKLPCIVYYELQRNGAVFGDNKILDETTTIIIEIISDSIKPNTIFNLIHPALQNAGFYFEWAQDAPADDGLYHKTAKYSIFGGLI